MLSILNKIKKERVEEFTIYRLGIFRNGSFDLVELDPKNKYLPHAHNISSAKFYIIVGSGKIILDDKERHYNVGDFFEVPKGMFHGFVPAERTLFLSIQNPPIKSLKTGKEDIHFNK